MLSKIWTAFLCISVLSGIATGRIEEVAQAAGQGSGSAVALLLEIAGLMVFWSGIMEIVSVSGIGSAIARLMRPLLQLLFGKAGRDRESMELVSAGVTANLLGLSNAATPLGLRAANRLYTVSGGRGCPDSVLTLIVLNTTSIQLIPTTVAAIRASLGAQAPFDIMPAVWCASFLSVAAALLAARSLRRMFPDMPKVDR